MNKIREKKPGLNIIPIEYIRIPDLRKHARNSLYQNSEVICGFLSQRSAF